MNIYNQIQEAVQFIRTKSSMVPEIGVILGSGLGDFADTLSEKSVIPYEEIPYFKRVSVVGHAGRLVIGKVQDKPVAVLQGRYHYYEGHDISDVVFPVRVLCSLGIKKILLTNAAGGINPTFAAGDLMLIRDHINLMGINPLRGENDDRLGLRFPDMTYVYDDKMIEIISTTMIQLGVKPKTGVYVALSGPTYETPAEIKMLSVLGGDAVGMSTVPESLVARHMNIPVAGISCISNLAAGISKIPLSHADVTETANRVKSNFIKVLAQSIPQL